MRSTGRWVVVIGRKNEEILGTRRLYTDRRGRDCVRYEKEWRLVEERRTELGRTYILGGLV